MSSDKKEEVDALVGASKQGGRPYIEPERIPLVLEEYNFKHARRGKAVIINNRDFNYTLTRQKNRDGTDVDAEALERLFVRMGFDVVRHDNMKPTDMTITMRQLSEEDHSDADCFVCAILSHGEEGVVYGTTGTVKLNSLVDNFKGDNCPTLVGKPKIFFIQACRGRKFDWGADMPDSGEDETDSGPEVSVRKIPVEADVLMAYSVVPGYFSWRNNIDGSWFIQAITRVFQEHADEMELMQMMTLVNKVVAFEFASCTDDDFTTNMKQVPCMASTLTKQVFFRPKY